MKRFSTTLLSVIAASSILIGFYTHSMEQVATNNSLSNARILQILRGLPQELKRAIIFLTLEKELSNFRCSTLLQGHIHYITSVAYSPDGNTVLTGSGDNSARLWNPNTGEQLHILQGHTSYITSLAYSPDGKTVITGSWDETARLWDVETGEPLHILQGHTGYISSVAFSPDGKTVITGSWDESARLWDVETGEPLHILQGHTGDIKSIAYSPNGKTVNAGSKDNTARLCGIVTGELLHILEGHTDCIQLVAYSPDGKTVLTGARDITARLWKRFNWNKETKKLFMQYYPVFQELELNREQSSIGIPSNKPCNKILLSAVVVPLVVTALYYFLGSTHNSL